VEFSEDKPFRLKERRAFKVKDSDELYGNKKAIWIIKEKLLSCDMASRVSQAIAVANCTWAIAACLQIVGSMASITLTVLHLSTSQLS